MQLADAFVLFSRYENLPCVLLEARCSGLPVIATYVGGIRYHINEEVDLLIAPEDEHALTEALLKMVEKAKNYNKKRLAAQPRQQYKAEAISAKFIQAYSVIFDKNDK
jgi:glycosyltransferase involved in cell wall biosynthesis